MAFFDHVVERCDLDGSGRLLDPGCGTEQLLLPLAHHVAGAGGLDPDPGMLAEAVAQAQAAGIDTTRWPRGSSGDLERLRDDLAPLRLTTSGRTFHWMEQDTTRRALWSMTVSGGGLVIAGDSEPV